MAYTFKELMEIMLGVIGRRRLLIPVPFALARFKAMFLGMLPNPLLTTDQVELLKQDNIVSGTLPGFAELGMAPKNIEVVLPSYLARFRVGGSLARPGPVKAGE